MVPHIDITGKRFGRLTAIKYVGNSKWLCHCDCGNDKIVRTDHLKGNKIKSCGCYNKERQKYNLTGQKFGRWTVINNGGKNKHGKTVWNCICECGNKQSITGTSLINGSSRSCGCLHQEIRSQYQDLTGQRFGRLVVIQYAYNGKWLCRCDCENEKIIRTGHLHTKTKSCGCILTDKQRNSKLSISHLIRNSKRYKEWRSNIFERDKYTCQICGDNNGGNLNAHHIYQFKHCINDEEILYNIDNGITLCEECHKEYHKKYGK